MHHRNLRGVKHTTEEQIHVLCQLTNTQADNILSKTLKLKYIKRKKVESKLQFFLENAL